MNVPSRYNWPKIIETPLRCPNCGKIPRLKERWHIEFQTLPWLVTYWYECRRWFGLKLCNRGPEHTNTKDWADFAQRCAAMKWNNSIEAKTIP